MPMYLTFEAKTSLVENVRSQPETVKFMGILLTAGKLKKVLLWRESQRTARNGEIIEQHIFDFQHKMKIF